MFCDCKAEERILYLKLLQPKTTPTMFFPMSCTSPLTVANTIVPL